MLQLQAPDRLRGRVMGFYSFVVLGMAPFGSLQAGWVAEHFGVRMAVAAGGLVCLAVAGSVAWGMWRNARHRRRKMPRGVWARRRAPAGRAGRQGGTRRRFGDRSDDTRLRPFHSASHRRILSRMLITISRQYGAGGSEVAQRVAAALGVAGGGQRADRAGGRPGGAPTGAGGGTGRARVRPSSSGWPGRSPPPPRRFSRPPTRPAPSSICPRPTWCGSPRSWSREIAARGRVVLVGRAAPAVLARERDALHVKLVAPRAWRIQVAAARLGVSAAKAAAILDDTDKMRARYSREYYRRDWNDPVNFHMVLNTGGAGAGGRDGGGGGAGAGVGWGEDGEGGEANEEGAGRRCPHVRCPPCRPPVAHRHPIRPHPNEIPPFPYPGSRRSGFIRV